MSLSITMNSPSIVLANLMSERGVLNDETIARINLAAQLESSQESHLILLCGWDYRPDCDIAIADAMREYLRVHHQKLYKKAICQRLSRDTVGDAVFSRIYLDKLFGNRAFDSVNIITSDYHVSRTKKVFEFVFGEDCSVFVKGATGFECNELIIIEEESLAAFRKTFSNATPGDINSIYSSLRANHPFYNGTVYPRIGEFCDVIRELKSTADSL
jgi:hypothetical protein